MPNLEWFPENSRGEGEMWHEVDNSWPTHKQIHVPAKIGCHVTGNIQNIVDTIQLEHTA